MLLRTRRKPSSLGLLAILATLVGCGSSTSSPSSAASTGPDASATSGASASNAGASSPSEDGGVDASVGAPADAAAGDAAVGDAAAEDAGSAPDDGGAGDGGLTIAQRTSAVTTTTTTDKLCTNLGDFYWEMGNATRTLATGSIGTTYGATKTLEIASASKFVFGAYMIQSTNGNLTDAEKSELRMLSGYYGLDPSACAGVLDVTACLNAGSPGPNYTYSASDIGSFYYGGAHDEYFAAQPTPAGLGLGADTTADLNALIMPVVGNPGFMYAFPEFAGGITSTPDQFGAFLQLIVAGKLLIHDYLGVDPVCTLPGTSCPKAIASPIPLAWHYSYNHWVEDDPTSDGAFSSAGAFGFYPWVTADKTMWGVLARADKAGNGNDDGDGTGPGYDSAACGLKMRAAWNTGVAQ